MSIWNASPMDGAEDSEPFARNSIAWDQLLNNLDLQISSDSSEDDEDEVPKSHASALSESKRSYPNGKLKLCSSSTGSRENPQKRKLVKPNHEDDGYSSEDEHDSPANQESSGSAIAGFCSSPGLTTTTKIGSAMGGGFEHTGPQDASKSYFFVKGVRHCVQDEQSNVKWTEMLPQTIPTTPSQVKVEPPVFTAAHQKPAVHVAPVSKTVIANNDAGAPVAWIYTPKTATNTPMPSRSPPRYEAVQAVPGAYAMPIAKDLKAVAAPPVMPRNVAYFPTDNKPSVGAPTAMPVLHTPSCMPILPVNSAPFLNGNATSFSVAAPTPNSIVGYVYIDSNGCLRVASEKNSPLPPPPPSNCPLPPPPLPSTQPPQFAHRSSEAAAIFQGASSVPGMNPMQYTGSYTADGGMGQPTIPSMPVSKSPPNAWGSTKAWVFRDSRWISLSM